MHPRSFSTSAALLLLIQIASAGCSGDSKGNAPGTGGDGGPGGGGSSVGDGKGDGGGGSSGPLPMFVPMFPGAGTGSAGAPLQGGLLCDYVPHAGEKGAEIPLTECFFSGTQTLPSATLEQVLECVEGQDVVHIRLTFDPAFVDNTYGASSIGWPARGGKVGKDGTIRQPHTFEQLLKSDHAEIILTNGDGEIAVHFKLDYITADPSAPSGYASLGVTGGEGEMIVGDPSAVIDATSSIDRNLNERGYGSYTVDSPATDASYTPNPDAPEWDYRVVYEAWIDVAAFGGSGFGDATIEFVHASPAKGSTDTIDVEPGECPPDWTPGCTNPDGCDGGPRWPGDGGTTDGCNNPDGCDGGPRQPTDACVVSGPDDDSCGGGSSNPGDPPPADYCTANPTDPLCTPT